MPLSPGEILNNRYRIVRLLGQGGFGAVYRAWDISFEIPCAIKENIESAPEAQRQFLREAKLLRTLRHPNLPIVTDYFVVVGRGQFLVMDYVEGEDLQSKLDKKGGPLQESEVIPWILEICDALTYLHSQKFPIIHRDIKPANIRITPEGKAMLVDFGIAKIYDPHSKTTIWARAVTPGFSPHEQYSEGKTDARTDVYALGATLYTLLTGKQPPESIQRVLKDPITSPEHLNPNLSVSTILVMRRALQVDPDARYQTASEFKQALSEPYPATARVSQTRSQELGDTLSQKEQASIIRTVPERKFIYIGALVAGVVLILAVLSFGRKLIASTIGAPPTEIQHSIVETTLASPTPFLTAEPFHTQETAIQFMPTATFTSVPLPTNTRESSRTPSPTPLSPEIIDFFFCDRPCDEAGAVRQTEFPERTTEIYAGFRYSAMSKGLRYTRIWAMGGNEWVRYDCTWQGPNDGVYYLKLWDKGGLKSGTWVVTMYIEGRLAYQASLKIAGSYDYWDPAGILPCNDW